MILNLKRLGRAPPIQGIRATDGVLSRPYRSPGSARVLRLGAREILRPHARPGDEQADLADSESASALNSIPECAPRRVALGYRQMPSDRLRQIARGIRGERSRCQPTDLAALPRR